MKNYIKLFDGLTEGMSEQMSGLVYLGICHAWSLASEWLTKEASPNTDNLKVHCTVH